MRENVPFEKKLSELKNMYEHGSFEYKDSSTNFTRIVTSHFRTISRKKERYGIYIVRQKNTQEVLYIGESGTFDSEGHLRGQDIPERLKNVKDGYIPANNWFRDLLKEKGDLLVEYIFLPNSEPPLPIEVALLQSYQSEYNCLPYKNKRV